LPKSIYPKEYEIMDKVLTGMQRWQRAVQEESKGEPVDPKGPISWEPVYGSRVMRARTKYLSSLGITAETKVAADFGFIFGLASNAIPSACWMLLHILDPNGDKTLLPRVMTELKTAQNSDGGLNVPHLISLPLLQSIFQEILRLYVDALVARDIHDDLILPFEDGKTSMVFRKGTAILAPSYISHRDESSWEAPGDGFYAERFLRQDPETGEGVFSMTGTAGRFFPFGGGKTICPGRVFAKQEVLAAVAMTLLQFEIEPLGYVDMKGEDSTKFPGLMPAFGGTGVMAMAGDLKVRMKKRMS